MAFWTPQQGWQTYNLPANFRVDFKPAEFAGEFPANFPTNFKVDFNPNEFASEFPADLATNLKTNFVANDFADQFPANKPDTQVVYVTFTDNGNSASISKDSSPGSQAVTIEGSALNAEQAIGSNIFNKLKGSNPFVLQGIFNTVQKAAISNQQDIVKRSTEATKQNNANKKTNDDNKALNDQNIQKRQDKANQLNTENQKKNQENQFKNQEATKLQQQKVDQLNAEGKKLNDKNTAINKWSQNTVNRLSIAKDGTYKNNANTIESQELKSILSPDEYSTYINTASDSFDGFYTAKVTTKWDPKTQGAQPPVGGFDATYYRTQTNGGPIADQQWNNALTAVSVNGRTKPDLDIVGKYGSADNYSFFYYTTQGKAAGDRGNAAQRAGIAEDYSEALTDADFQLYRDKVLGLSDRFDDLQDWIDAQDPKILAEWVNSLPADQKRAFNDGTLPVPTLDSVPDRLRGKIVLEKEKTILEGELGAVLTAKDKQQQQTFGSLTSDSLKQAAAELQRVKANETQFDFFSGLEGFSEIFSLNESISNSILGDSGVGGVLGFAANTERTSEGLEKSLGQITGVPSRSNAVYNWQKWFDEQLLTRYQKDATFQDPTDPNNKFTLDAEFAKDYIERYLKPRFDNSKSLTEFISYLDVKQNEQNIFQTQSALDSLRDIADLRARAFLDGVRGQDPLNFDTKFYFDPTGNFSADDPKFARYAEQKAEVAKDWEDARTRGDTVKIDGLTWNQWAYFYGLDVNDPEQFAKLNYQVKGAARGFDPAKDLITLKDAEDYIQNTIIPEIANEKLNIGDISFLNFVTPEEFADNLLEGIDPAKQKEEFDKVLESLGLGGQQLGIDEVKQYIVEAFRTGAAEKIRESIKFLNEKKLRPTQERLGVDYIERPEDFKPTSSPNETELYKIFRNAGYQGSEDEFFDSFLTDVDRSEVELLTQGQKGLQLGGTFAGLTSRDPFKALASIETLFPEEKPAGLSSKREAAAPSYFSIFTDNNRAEDFKSESGKKILGEFTSLFKGVS
jgi:hypothetical protein